MVRCPTELELERFLAGELEAPAAERVRAHASECATCATWVREARADDVVQDTWLAALRPCGPPQPPQRWS